MTYELDEAINEALDRISRGEESDEEFDDEEELTEEELTEREESYNAAIADICGYLARDLREIAEALENDENEFSLDCAFLDIETALDTYREKHWRLCR